MKSPTEEILDVRRELAAKFDNDIKRIGEDIRRQQRESGRTYINLPKRTPQTFRGTANATVRSDTDDASGDA